MTSQSTSDPSSSTHCKANDDDADNSNNNGGNKVKNRIETLIVFSLTIIAILATKNIRRSLFIISPLCFVVDIEF
jgi:hypothetical protein